MRCAIVNTMTFAPIQKEVDDYIAQLRNFRVFTLIIRGESKTFTSNDGIGMNDYIVF